MFVDILVLERFQGLVYVQLKLIQVVRIKYSPGNGTYSIILSRSVPRIDFSSKIKLTW